MEIHLFVQHNAQKYKIQNKKIALIQKIKKTIDNIMHRSYTLFILVATK